jgi:hypothetical protein
MHVEETQPSSRGPSRLHQDFAAGPQVGRSRQPRRCGRIALAAMAALGMATLGAAVLAPPAQAQTSLQWLNRQSGGLPPASQALTEAQARESCRLQFGPPSRRESRRGYNEKLRQCINQRMQGR